MASIVIESSLNGTLIITGTFFLSFFGKYSKLGLKEGEKSQEIGGKTIALHSPQINFWPFCSLSSQIFTQDTLILAWT